MEERIMGEYTTMETRADAHEAVDKQKRYSQIIECLTQCGALTAKECAVIMQGKGYIPTSERNFTAPRMTELTQNGVIKVVGKTVDAYTGRKVAVYGLKEVG